MIAGWGRNRSPMDTAAPKLDLEGSMGLGLVHSGQSRPCVLPDSGTGPRHNMFRVVGDTGLTGNPLEKASHPSSTGQQVEDSFICSLTRSDRLLCEGFTGPLSPWLPGWCSAFKTFGRVHAHWSFQQSLERGSDVPHTRLTGGLHCSPHPNPHPLCTMSSASLHHLLVSTIPASSPGSHFWIS